MKVMVSTPGIHHQQHMSFFLFGRFPVPGSLQARVKADSK